MTSTPPQDASFQPPPPEEHAGMDSAPKAVGHLFDVGGDDPDFFLARPGDKTSLLCRVPGLRAIAPQCR